MTMLMNDGAGEVMRTRVEVGTIVCIVFWVIGWVTWMHYATYSAKTGFMCRCRFVGLLSLITSTTSSTLNR